MLFSKTSAISFGLLASSRLVAGHAAVIKAVGDAGGQGSAIGGMCLPQSIQKNILLTGHS